MLCRCFNVCVPTKRRPNPKARCPCAPEPRLQVTEPLLEDRTPCVRAWRASLLSVLGDQRKGFFQPEALEPATAFNQNPRSSAVNFGPCSSIRLQHIGQRLTRRLGARSSSKDDPALKDCLIDGQALEANPAYQEAGDAECIAGIVDAA